MFLSYFITALQNVVPGIGQPILNALQSPQPPPTDLLLTALVNSISSYEDDFALVLDDYHTVETQAVHEVVSFLVEHLPLHAHLVITSRSDPPLPLPRWRVRGGAGRDMRQRSYLHDPRGGGLLADCGGHCPL